MVFKQGTHVTFYVLNLKKMDYFKGPHENFRVNKNHHKKVVMSCKVGQKVGHTDIPSKVSPKAGSPKWFINSPQTLQ